MSVYVRTVKELIEVLKELPKDTIVCDSDSGNDGLELDSEENFTSVMFKGVWEGLLKLNSLWKHT